MPQTETLNDRFMRFETTLSGQYYERVRECRCAVLALLSRRHMFIYGPPGTAKSQMIRTMAHLISDVGDGGYFQWLLTKYSTPEELFGPPSLPDLEQGRMRRVTTSKLPEARIAFLDEIFKGSSSILNTLLTIMNERMFFNGDDRAEVPLSSIFAASNELPDDEGLNALWDRLLFRFQVDRLRERSNFEAMLISHTGGAEPEPVVTWDEVTQAQAAVNEVNIPASIYQAMVTLRENLAADGVEPSDRRWVETLPVIRAEAWLGGRDQVIVRDLRILRHMLWDRPEDQHPVDRVVLELADPTEKRVQELLRSLRDLEGEFQKAVDEADDDRAVAKSSVEIHHKLGKIRTEVKEISAQEDADKIDLLPELRGTFRHVAERLVHEGFGMKNPGDVADLDS